MPTSSQSQARVLNVGGGSKSIPIPARYDGWEHVLLDIDPLGEPDIVMDARELPIKGEKFDAIYCSHNLEHYYRHDVRKVLRGFVLSLNEDGYAHIRVPNIEQIMRKFVAGAMDIESVLYISPAGPITVHDVIYGHGQQLEVSGQDFYAHKTGFTPTLIGRMLGDAGFHMAWIAENDSAFEIEVFAHLKE